MFRKSISIVTPFNTMRVSYASLISTAALMAIPSRSFCASGDKKEEEDVLRKFTKQFEKYQIPSELPFNGVLNAGAEKLKAAMESGVPTQVEKSPFRYFLFNFNVFLCCFLNFFSRWDTAS